MDDPKYNIFVKWYAMPESARDPQTIPEFCDRMKIPLKRVAEFHEHETFTDDLVKASLEWGKSKFPELLGIVYEKAKSTKGLNDIKTFADLLSGGQKKELEELKDQNKKKKGTTLRDLFKD